MGNKKLIHDSIYWDCRLSWASAIFFIGSVGNASLKSILPIPESLWGIISILVGILIIGFYALCFKEMITRSSRIFWRSLSIFLLLYLLSAVLITIRGESMTTMITGSALLTFAWWIPSGVFACSVYDKEILYNIWVKSSYIISAFSIIIFFFHIPDKQYEELAEYNMAFGFFIILPLLIQINEYQRKHRLWLLLLVLFEIFTILIYANRSILLSLVFFLTYKFAFESNSRLRKILSILFLLVIGFVMLSSIQTIAIVAVDVLETFGLESRTLDMLAEGVIKETTGRDNIWRICFKMIEEKPFLGWGLGGEFHHLTQAIFGSATIGDSAACSPHNGVVQNFVNFGILGGFVSTLIIIIPILYIWKVKDPYTKILIIIFFASRVIPNLISGDGFFTEPKVAIYLYLFYFWKKGNNKLESLSA